MTRARVRGDFSDVGRRQFLKGGAAAAVAGLVGPFAFLQTKAAAQSGALFGHAA